MVQPHSRGHRRRVVPLLVVVMLAVALMSARSLVPAAEDEVAVTGRKVSGRSAQGTSPAKKAIDREVGSMSSTSTQKEQRASAREPLVPAARPRSNNGGDQVAAIYYFYSDFANDTTWMMQRSLEATNPDIEQHAVYVTPDVFTKGERGALKGEGFVVYLTKVTSLLEAVKRHRGKIIVYCDTDIVFYAPIAEKLVASMSEVDPASGRPIDIAFQGPRKSDNPKAARPSQCVRGSISIGFMAIRCNEATEKFFTTVKDNVITPDGRWMDGRCDQAEVVFQVRKLGKSTKELHIGCLPKEFWSPGLLRSERKKPRTPPSDALLCHPDNPKGSWKGDWMPRKMWKAHHIAVQGCGATGSAASDLTALQALPEQDIRTARARQIEGLKTPPWHQQGDQTSAWDPIRIKSTGIDAIRGNVVAVELGVAEWAMSRWVLAASVTTSLQKQSNFALVSLDNKGGEVGPATGRCEDWTTALKPWWDRSGTEMPDVSSTIVWLRTPAVVLPGDFQNAVRRLLGDHIVVIVTSSSSGDSTKKKGDGACSREAVLAVIAVRQPGAAAADLFSPHMISIDELSQVSSGGVVGRSISALHGKAVTTAPVGVAICLLDQIDDDDARKALADVYSTTLESLQPAPSSGLQDGAAFWALAHRRCGVPIEDLHEDVSLRVTPAIAQPTRQRGAARTDRKSCGNLLVDEVRKNYR